MKLRFLQNGIYLTNDIGEIKYGLINPDNTVTINGQSSVMQLKHLMPKWDRMGISIEFTN